MKKIVAFAAAAALVSIVSANAMATEKAAEHKTSEDMCKAQAEKDKVSADKMAAYVKTCVEKHARAPHAAKPAGK
ncbi:MAG: hypothetical protein AB1810_03875 [Pseudomonadota bacterium]